MTTTTIDTRDRALDSTGSAGGGGGCMLDHPLGKQVVEEKMGKRVSLSLSLYLSPT